MMERRGGRRTTADGGAIESVVTLGARTDIGLKRSANQDAYVALIGANAPSDCDALLAVADGMGGHKAGEVASDMAVRSLVRKLGRPSQGDRTPVTGGLVVTIQRTVSEINSEVHKAASRPETRGMGTTLTMAVLTGQYLTLGHVGDSRAYLLRDGQLHQLTRDHSWVAEQVARGSISPADAERHPRRNILTRAIGVDPRVEVDTTTVEVKERDLVLLASDGLHSLVTDGEIAEILGGGDPQAASRELVGRANALGGNDNITVVVVRIESLGPRRPSAMGVHDATTVLSGGSPAPSLRGALAIAGKVLSAPLWLPVLLLYRTARRLFRRGS